VNYFFAAILNRSFNKETRMSIIDLLIGLTLMNAMPHFVLGVWKGRMFSAFGFGNRKNMLYGAANLVLSLGLYFSKYGPEQLLHNGIYAGALVLLLIYFLTARFWYVLFQEKPVDHIKPV
jgi:hypothetical protein